MLLHGATTPVMMTGAMTEQERPGPAMIAPGPRQDTPASGLTVAEAAARLGVTPDAVRRRLHRGTLAGEKTEDREWRVWLPEPVPETAPGDARPDAARTSPEPASMPPGPDTTPPTRSPADQELIDVLQSEVQDLRARLDAESEARRRADHLVANLMARLPEVVSSGTATDAPVTHESGTRSGDTLAAASEPYQPVSDTLALSWRRWWRRIRGS